MSMIEVRDVSMRFNMAKERVDNLKEFFIKKAKGTLKFEEFYALRGVSLTVERGDAIEPAVTIAAPSPEPVAAMVYGKVPVGELASAGLVIDGDSTVLARFVDCFHLPAKCGT